MILLHVPQTLQKIAADIPVDAFDSLLPFDNQYVVSVHLMSREEIRRLNRERRGLDEPTDVLSFPLYDGTAALPDHPAPLGDLAVCLDEIDLAALNERECLIHGTLHLLGFDHEMDAAAWSAARAGVKVK